MELSGELLWSRMQSKVSVELSVELSSAKNCRSHLPVSTGFVCAQSLFPREYSVNKRHATGLGTL